MNLTVKLQSYTACASGEGAGLIDSDVVTDHLGYPYLPGRRIKGLLRESAIEVTEMLGYGAEHLDALFGNGGFIPGTLKIPNIHLSDYEQMRSATEHLLEDSRCRPFLHREKLTAFFTEVRQQTALDDNGIACEASLRITRMLKPGLEFSVELQEPDNPPCMALLWLAAKNLRRMGTRRNRGQGRITCNLVSTVASLEDACKMLRQQAAKTEQNVVDAVTPATTTTERSATCRMPVRIVSKGPLVISEPLGDENTVTSAGYLPGQSLRGLCAAQIMHALGLNRNNAHLNQTFRNLVLAQPPVGGISYGPSFYSIGDTIFNQAPLMLHATKKYPDTALNLLEQHPHDAKYIGRQIDLSSFEESDLRHASPRKALFFHTTRKNNRRAGVSTEQDGTIFFYEALDAGQQFKGWIHGPLEQLEQLRQLTGDQFEGVMGRSRSAQYGAVEVTLGQAESRPVTELEFDVSFTLVLLSPLILRNEFGFPELSLQRLEHTLSELLGQDVTVSESFVRTTTIQSFLGVAGIKQPAEAAFAEGSTFRISYQAKQSVMAEEALQQLADQTCALGELTGSGYGRVAVVQLDNEEWRLSKYSRPKEKLLSGDIPESLRTTLQHIVQQEVYSHLAEQGLQDARQYAGTPLTNSQIGRLESLLKGAADADSLNKNLRSIRDTVRKRMDDCVKSGGATLLECLETPCTIPADKAATFIDRDLNHLIRSADLEKISAENDFKAARIYWQALLRRMRKLNKIQRGGGR